MSNKPESEWERIDHSIRYVPAEAKSHLVYFTSSYKRVVRQSDGSVGWETKPGKAIYARELTRADLDKLPVGLREKALLATQLIEPLLKVLDEVEKRLGGPPL